ncbi:GNAT family N-acetyltransferase [Halopseudomonas bauzanensis]|uniref:GNAT family N-acetyltransferase n=1 Tax=Halopseudomonas bauzanensis TaxID=653930 RepID=UPI00145F3750|nr:GNAT family protein [Halopseudomonas bauzanensis]
MSIRLVRVNSSHAQARFEALSDVRVSKWVFIDLPVSEAKTKQWCETVGERSSRIDFCFEVEGKAAGFAGLVNINQTSGTCELYIFLHPSFFSQGLGSKFLYYLLAYGKLELNLRKISLFVTGDNDKAISFYERNGFTTEGVLRRHSWFRGEYRDRIIMSIFTDALSTDAEPFYQENL